MKKKIRLLSSIFIFIILILIDGCTKEVHKGLRVIELRREGNGPYCSGSIISIKSELGFSINISLIQFYADRKLYPVSVLNPEACVLNPNESIDLFIHDLGCKNKTLTEPIQTFLETLPAGTVIQTKGKFPDHIRIGTNDYFSEIKNPTFEDVATALTPATFTC